jgi:hypothetical protein
LLQLSENEAENITEIYISLDFAGSYKLIINYDDNKTSKVPCAFNDSDLQERLKDFYDDVVDVEIINEDELKKIKKAYKPINRELISGDNSVHKEWLKQKVDVNNLEVATPTIGLKLREDNGALAADFNRENLAALESLIKQELRNINNPSATKSEGADSALHKLLRLDEVKNNTRPLC